MHNPPLKLVLRASTLLGGVVLWVWPLVPLPAQVEIGRELSLALDPKVVTGGETSVATVDLRDPAPARGGATITIDNGDPDEASMPRTLFIRPGASVGRFTIETRPVDESHEIEIAVTYSRSTARGTLTVHPPRALSLRISRERLFASEDAEVTLDLDGPAPAGGLDVAIANDAPAAIIAPAKLHVDQGSTSIAFTISARNVLHSVRATIRVAFLDVSVFVKVDVLSGNATDLALIALEVTQGIQDLENSVPLVAGRRTWVRAHARIAPWTRLRPRAVTAELFVRRLDPPLGTSGDWIGPIIPVNPSGAASLVADPSRGERDLGFYFEVPTELGAAEPSVLEDGSASLEICVDLDPSDSIPEFDEADNHLCTEVTLRRYNDLEVTIFKVRLDLNGTLYPVADQHVFHLVSWLERAYPTRKLIYEIRDLDWPQQSFPTCDKLNSVLEDLWRQDGSPRRRRYYGLVADDFSFMRGCSAGIPAAVASGPAGTGTFGWDNDGSYADWYGGHELGHTFGRFHTRGHGMDDPPGSCGEEAGPGFYPYPGGHIGGPEDDPNRYFGWDVELQTVYPPSWTDVMTYCDRQWVSDYTYRRILAALGELGPMCPQIFAHCEDPWPDSSRFIIIRAFVIPDPISVIPDFFTVLDDVRPPGVPAAHPDWSIRFADSANHTLAAYSTVPRESSDPAPGEVPSALIAETLPWDAATARIEILYQGEPIAERVVTPRPPTARWLMPIGGTTLDGESVELSWQASDPDGDPLSYSIQLSVDDGIHWLTLASGIEEPAVEIPIGLLPASDLARFRLVATDGVRTTVIPSEPFRIPPRAPRVAIVHPEDGATYVPGELIAFRARAYDPDEGPIEDDSRFEWTESGGRLLGSGSAVDVSALGNGRHSITVTAEGADGERGSASIEVTVGSTLPPFRRGDCNNDSKVDISDAVCILTWLFLGGEAPGCAAGTNVNGDPAVDISDPVSLLAHLFLGGPAPQAPFPLCGVSESEADLRIGCETEPRSCE